MIRLSLSVRPVVVALIMTLTACTPSPGGTVTPAVSASASAAKQEITTVMPAGPTTLDPQVAVTVASQIAVMQISETLTYVEWLPSGEGKISPMLATSWKLLNDTTWQFKLRENVRFTNGETFDAVAVKFSFDRLVGPDSKSGGAARFRERFERIDVVDDHTVNLVTKGPFPSAPTYIIRYLYIVPPKYATEVGWASFGIKPIGTGPFKLTEWVKDDHITLEANPDHWAGRPKLNKITIKPIPEASTRSAAIQTGAADIVTDIAGADVPVLQQRSGFKIDITKGTRSMWLFLDQAKDKILANVKVRQALNYAVNKEAIVKAVYNGYADVLQGQTLTPAYFGFNPALKSYPYDPELAKRLLAEAGYPNGFDMRLTTPRAQNYGDYEMTQAAAGDLNKIGIRATVNVAEMGAYSVGLRSGAFTPAVWGGMAPGPDGENMFDYFRAGGNFSMTNMPEFNELFKQQRALLDPQKRLVVLQEMAKIEREQAFALFLIAPHNFTAIRDGVQGFRLGADGYYYFKDTYVK